MTVTDIILFVIFCLFVLMTLDMYFDISIFDSDERHSKQIAKYINKGNFYKAVSLCKKYNQYVFFAKFVEEYATDNFESFVRTLYIYKKRELGSKCHNTIFLVITT